MLRSILQGHLGENYLSSMIVMGSDPACRMDLIWHLVRRTAIHRVLADVTNQSRYTAHMPS